MSSLDMDRQLLRCPVRRHWVSFRLVDEFGEGKPYAGLSYELTDKEQQKYTGVLDKDGYAVVENMYCGPAVVSFYSLAHHLLPLGKKRHFLPGRAVLRGRSCRRLVLGRWGFAQP